VGRFVRTIRGRAPEPSWLYLPADPLLRRHAAEVESELRHVLRPAREEEGLEEPRERRASEPSPSAEFVPLSAEVAPQMTLFGPAPALPNAASTPGAAGAAAAERHAPGAGGPGGHEQPAPLAAFERRDGLRERRRELVGELHRRGGLSHREINAWLNRKVGVQRVESATIEQLERSIETLLKELTRRRPVVSGRAG
jgi:hypothetical protein